MKERIPDTVALPLADAMRSHQGLTKGQISEARAQLQRLAAFDVRMVDSGKRDDQDRPLMVREAHVKAYRVQPDDMTKNERLLLPLLLDYAARDFSHDHSKRKLAEHPTLIEARAKEAEKHREKHAEAQARIDADAALSAKVEAAVSAAVAPLASLIERLTAALPVSPVAPLPPPAPSVVTPPLAPLT